MQSSKNKGRRYTAMNKRKLNPLYTPLLRFLLTVLIGMLLVNFSIPGRITNKTGFLKISFNITVKGVPLTLNDSVYTNAFGEDFRINKFKFYISEPGVMNPDTRQRERSGYHLVDAKDAVSQSMEFAVKEGTYNSLFFLLGVDSAHNCSGAQSGALDPMNDMFWTWNSGYVMAKLEGVSHSSSSIANRMEYHIGGYRGPYNVLQQVIQSRIRNIGDQQPADVKSNGTIYR